MAGEEKMITLGDMFLMYIMQIFKTHNKIEALKELFKRSNVLYFKVMEWLSNEGVISYVYIV